MTSHDIQLLLVDLALILVLARLLGALARALGQPAVIGEIVAGILLGPTLFGGAITRNLFPTELRPPLTALADIGLVLFMFIVGYDLDATLVRGRERIAASVSAGSILLPMVGGFLLGLWLAGRHPHHGSKVAFALFVGASMSVTAFPVLARILTDRGLHRTRLGGLAIASASVDDISAWSLLAVVVTIAGANGSDEWHILLAPAYLLIMAFVVRPLMRVVADRYQRLGRLTPDQLAVVLAVLLLSACATEWMNVHFIFGAFIFGTIMPREAAAPLRQAILERLEQISVLLLLPVFFVVSGLSVNLAQLDGRLVLELLAILAVAVAGKFLGAFGGALSAGVPSRQAGALATLMNTRGLTEIVILTVGLQLKVLDPKLFSLMVVMAIVTTAMTGPLLRAVYPPRLVERDLADAARAELDGGAGYRVIAVLGAEPDAQFDRALVGLAVDLAAAHRRPEVVITRLVRSGPRQRLEMGTGLGAELLAMTSIMAELHALAGEGIRRGVSVSVHSQFSEDPAADLTRHVIVAAPDLLVRAVGTALEPHNLMPRSLLIEQLWPSDPTAVSVLSGAGPDGALALQLAAALAISSGLTLYLSEAPGRRDHAVLDELTRRGIAVETARPPEGAVIVAAGPEPTAHLAARARPDDELDDVGEWAELIAVAEAPPTEEQS